MFKNKTSNIVIKTMDLFSYGTKKKIHTAVGATLFLCLLITAISPRQDISKITGVLAFVLWIFRQWLWASMRRQYLKAKVEVASSNEYIFTWVMVSWVLGLSMVFTPAFLVILETVPANYDFTKFRLSIGAFIAVYSIYTLLKYQKEKRDEERRDKILKQRELEFYQSRLFSEENNSSSKKASPKKAP